jgi:hypothetical protein
LHRNPHSISISSDYLQISTGIDGKKTRTIKSRRMGWAGHVARIGEKRDACRILVGKPEGKRPLGRPRREWTIVRQDGMVWIGLIWLRIGTSGGLL